MEEEDEDGSAGVAEGDGRPRRDKLVTEYPSKVARLQIVCPKNPVPPKTSSLPFFFDVAAMLEDMVILVERLWRAWCRCGRIDRSFGTKNPCTRRGARTIMNTMTVVAAAME